MIVAMTVGGAVSPRQTARIRSGVSAAGVSGGRSGQAGSAISGSPRDASQSQPVADFERHALGLAAAAFQNE